MRIEDVKYVFWYFPYDMTFEFTKEYICKSNKFPLYNFLKYYII